MNDGFAYTNDRNKAVTGQLAWTDKFKRGVEKISSFVAWNVASFIFTDQPALSMRWRKHDDGSLESISFEGNKNSVSPPLKCHQNRRRTPNVHQ